MLICSRSTDHRYAADEPGRLLPATVVMIFGRSQRYFVTLAGVIGAPGVGGDPGPSPGHAGIASWAGQGRAYGG